MFPQLKTWFVGKKDEDQETIDRSDPFSHLNRPLKTLSNGLPNQKSNLKFLEKLNDILSQETDDTRPQPHFIDENDDWLLLSGIFTLENGQEWQEKYQISHIINMADGDIFGSKVRAERFEALGMKYLGIKAQDEERYEIMKHWVEVKQFVQDFQQQNINKKTRLLIHCMAGVNRSAALAVGIVCFIENKTLFESVQQIHQKRGSILWNKAFRSRLVDWAREEKYLE